MLLHSNKHIKNCSTTLRWTSLTLRLLCGRYIQRMKYLLPLLFFILTPVVACELTQEYREARREISTVLRQQYYECTNAVSSYLYWKGVASCREGDILRDCSHYSVDGEAYKALSEHCEVLRGSIEDRVSALQQYAKKSNIEKCKPLE